MVFGDFGEDFPRVPSGDISESKVTMPGGSILGRQGVLWSKVLLLQCALQGSWEGVRERVWDAAFGFWTGLRHYVYCLTRMPVFQPVVIVTLGDGLENPS